MIHVTRRVARQEKMAVLLMNATNIGIVIAFDGVLVELSDILDR